MQPFDFLLRKYLPQFLHLRIIVPACIIYIVSKYNNCCKLLISYSSYILADEIYKNGNGVVQQCYYYDRRYRRQGRQVTPPQLISCFFPYSHQGILNLINHEICCDFTHMIVTDCIDLDSNTTPLCGAI